MARGDIMPYISVHGNTHPPRYAPMNASETFQRGELVFINTDGELAEFPVDATEALIADIGTGGLLGGIACFGPGAASAAADPTNAVAINPKTGVAFTTGDSIGYWPWDRGTLFITNNVLAAGGAATALPDGADRGVQFQLTYGTVGTPDAGWAVEKTAGVTGTDVLAVIHDVLDSQLRPVSATDTTTGVYYVFEIRTSAS